jgi:hypothetical protein
MKPTAACWFQDEPQDRRVDEDAVPAPRSIYCADKLKAYVDKLPAGAMIGIFLFPTASRPALGPTQSPIQWVSGALFPGGQAAGAWPDNSPQSSAEVKTGHTFPLLL